MPYPPVPTDHTGNPYPVIWNEATNNWEVYKGKVSNVILGPDGEPIFSQAKPGIVKFSEPQEVKTVGNMMALDPVSGNPQPFSVIKDDDGNFVLRTVLAALSPKTALLQSHLNNTSLIDNAFWIYGKNSIGSHTLVQPIDVSYHEMRTLVFYNYHNQPLLFRELFFFPTIEPGMREISTTQSGFTRPELQIPAFDSTFNVPGRLAVHKTNCPNINLGFPGMGFDIRQTAIAPTAGYLDIYVFGSSV